ncbi:MAG: glycoside hydrolase family 3 protein [Chloroflexi bacterium]|nr:glycoside hydrolase family 3 protein [Chloroflexota bacterium]
MLQLMHSFRGAEAPAEVLDAVTRGVIGSFCLFSGLNVESPAQVRRLNESLLKAAADGGHLPPMLGIDQEGGQLIAIRGGTTELPGNMALGATRDESLAEQAGRVLARELRAMGFNMIFAPSVDVNINPRNPVIGTRSFGEDPVWVARLGTAMIRGLQGEGMIATAKHFPGHGDTAVDSHHEVPIVPHDMERMNAVELYPFKAAIKAGVGAVMTAHVLFSVLDSTTPATVSPAILTGLLRNELGFGGLIVTDAMDMQAVARLGTERSIRLAIEAGADLILLAHVADQLEIARRVSDATRPEAAARIETARKALTWELPPMSIIGCRDHQEIAETIARRAITVVKGGNLLPMTLAARDEIAVITVRPQNLTPADTSSEVTIGLDAAIRERHNATTGYELDYGATDGMLRDVLEATRDAKIVIAGTINASDDPAQAALVNALLARGQRTIVVALRTPYDLAVFPEVDAYLCAYSIRRVSIEATAGVLFGEFEATGILPCTVPSVLA